MESLWLLGHDEQAAAFYDVISESELRVTLAIGFRSAETLAAVAAAAGERWELAEKHFAEALATAHAQHNRVEQAEISRLHAHMLLERDAAGDRERARGFLDEALADYEKFGMPRHAEITQTMLDRC